MRHYQNTKKLVKSVKSIAAHEAIPEKLPAILRTGAVVPQLQPVRIAVHKNGEALIRLDDRVEIVLHY